MGDDKKVYSEEEFLETFKKNETSVTEMGRESGSNEGEDPLAPTAAPAADLDYARLAAAVIENLIHQAGTYYGHVLLKQAHNEALRGDLGDVQAIFSKLPTKSTEMHTRALQGAIEGNHPAVIEYMLEAGASPEKLLDRMRSESVGASAESIHNAQKLIIENGNHFDRAEVAGDAARHGDVATLKVLFEGEHKKYFNADNGVDEWGMRSTAEELLGEALKSENPEAAAYLISQGADYKQVMKDIEMNETGYQTRAEGALREALENPHEELGAQAAVSTPTESLQV